MDIKYLEKLEFNKICNTLERFAITYIGKELCTNLLPYNNKKDIEKALKQTSEASTILYRKGNLPLYEIQNISLHLKRLDENYFLSSIQLLDLANILKLARNLKEYYFNNDIELDEFINLNSLFNNLYINLNIENTIFSSILDENTISDNASLELASIRKNIRSKEQEIKSKLNSFLHSKYIQEPVITIRNNRFVIPVKNEYRSEVKGFIHDISSSGSTVFVEPISIFELNNDLNSLKNDESIEIEKILQKLSSLFFTITDNLSNNINLVGLIDFIFAKAKYSNSLDACEPKINENKYVIFLQAWHPLIDANIAVKNDISIGEHYTSLIITGPNTGGKTVILKTVGLLVLMAMSGLHITAKEGSSFYIFDNIFADIGDDQSITDSLSTFSSHMTNIAKIIKESTSNSLVLVDELGSGTDPIEGSNLAISILESFHTKGSLIISTTHYPDIKNFALVTSGFENASVEFNLDTLSPTFNLLIGVPGQSNAFTISQKLGIPEDIIIRAKSLIDTDIVNIEELLNNIYENKRITEIEKQKVSYNSSEIESLKEKLDIDYSELKSKEKEIIDNAKIKARDIFISAKEDANVLINQIEKTNDSKKLNGLRNDINKKIDNLNVVKDIKQNSDGILEKDIIIGLEVFISSINQNGNILSLPSKSGTVQVGVGIMKMSFNISELSIAKPVTKSKKEFDYSKKRNFMPKSTSSEINVIGQNVEDSCFVIDKYLDNCYLSGLSSIRIVHGKGTGALKAGIHKFLKTHPHVKDFRMGTFGEGEMGVTVVNLK